MTRTTPKSRPGRCRRSTRSQVLSRSSPRKARIAAKIPIGSSDRTPAPKKSVAAPAAATSSPGRAPRSPSARANTVVAQDLVADHAADRRRREVGGADPAQLEVGVDLAAGGDLQRRYVEQAADDRHAGGGEHRREVQDQLAPGDAGEPRRVEAAEEARLGERPEQQPGGAGAGEVDAENAERQVEAREQRHDAGRQDQVVAETPVDQPQDPAGNQPRQPERQVGRLEERRERPDVDAGVQRHADRAEHHQIAGGGEEAADERIGNEADEKAEPEAAAEPGERPGQRRRRGDEGDHGREQRLRRARPAAGDVGDREREDDGGASCGWTMVSR